MNTEYTRYAGNRRPNPKCGYCGERLSDKYDLDLSCINKKCKLNFKTTKELAEFFDVGVPTIHQATYIDGSYKGWEIVDTGKRNGKKTNIWGEM